MFQTIERRSSFQVAKMHSARSHLDCPTSHERSPQQEWSLWATEPSRHVSEQQNYTPPISDQQLLQTWQTQTYIQALAEIWQQKFANIEFANKKFTNREFANREFTNAERFSNNHQRLGASKEELINRVISDLQSDLSTYFDEYARMGLALRYPLFGSRGVNNSYSEPTSAMTLRALKRQEVLKLPTTKAIIDHRASLALDAFLNDPKYLQGQKLVFISTRGLPEEGGYPGLDSKNYCLINIYTKIAPGLCEFIQYRSFDTDDQLWQIQNELMQVFAGSEFWDDYQQFLPNTQFFDPSDRQQPPLNKQPLDPSDRQQPPLNTQPLDPYNHQQPPLDARPLNLSDHRQSSQNAQFLNSPAPHHPRALRHQVAQRLILLPHSTDQALTATTKTKIKTGVGVGVATTKSVATTTKQIETIILQHSDSWHIKPADFAVVDAQAWQEQNQKVVASLIKIFAKSIQSILDANPNGPNIQTDKNIQIDKFGENFNKLVTLYVRDSFIRWVDYVAKNYTHHRAAHQLDSNQIQKMWEQLTSAQKNQQNALQRQRQSWRAPIQFSPISRVSSVLQCTVGSFNPTKLSNLSVNPRLGFNSAMPNGAFSTLTSTGRLVDFQQRSQLLLSSPYPNSSDKGVGNSEQSLLKLQLKAIQEALDNGYAWLDLRSKGASQVYLVPKEYLLGLGCDFINGQVVGPCQDFNNPSFANFDYRIPLNDPIDTLAIPVNPQLADFFLHHPLEALDPLIDEKISVGKRKKARALIKKLYQLISLPTKSISHLIAGIEHFDTHKFRFAREIANILNFSPNPLRTLEKILLETQDSSSFRLFPSQNYYPEDPKSSKAHNQDLGPDRESKDFIGVLFVDQTIPEGLAL